MFKHIMQIVHVLMISKLMNELVNVKYPLAHLYLGAKKIFLHTLHTCLHWKNRELLEATQMIQNGVQIQNIPKHVPQ